MSIGQLQSGILMSRGLSIQMITEPSQFKGIKHNQTVLWSSVWLSCVLFNDRWVWNTGSKVYCIIKFWFNFINKIKKMLNGLSYFAFFSRENAKETLMSQSKMMLKFKMLEIYSILLKTNGLVWFMKYKNTKMQGSSNIYESYSLVNFWMNERRILLWSPDKVSFNV